MDKLPQLPAAWISKIFGHMAAYYGTLFTDRWKGINLSDVQSVWATELASFSDNPECFKGALKALIEGSAFPPTLPEFVALCRRNYVRPKPVAIEHKLSAEEIERNKQRVKQMAEMIARRHP